MTNNDGILSPFGQYGFFLFMFGGGIFLCSCVLAYNGILALSNVWMGVVTILWCWLLSAWMRCRICG